MNDRDPWVYKTTDFGATWRAITGGLPRTPLSYAHAIAEDPARRGLLYLGTENGIYVSFDDGARWQPLQTNLPHAPVYWITVQPRFRDLVIATYGRGFWILDDVTALRELAAAVPNERAHLFAMRDAYRFRDAETPFAIFDDPTNGQIPPYGAAVSYWVGKAPNDSLKRAVGAKPDTTRPAPADSVTITIADASAPWCAP